MTTRPHAVWRDLLGPDDAAALDPGVPERLERHPDVAVVGGGMVGVGAALACREARLGTVVVLERRTLGGDASGGALGLLTPAAHSGTDPGWFVDLAEASLARWRDLDGREGVGLVDVDWIGIEPHAPGFRPPTGSERLTSADVAGLVPGLAEPVPGVRVPGQARVNPLEALARLARRVPSVATGVDVTGVVTHAGRITRLETSVGTLEPGVVVFATGGPPDLPDLALPSHRVKGHLIATAPAPVALPGPVEPVGVPLPDGRLLVGGTLDVADHSPDVDPDVVASLRDWLAAYLPATAGLGLTHAWCCFRPAHDDRLPVLDRVPGIDNAWLTSGHYRTGILLAPVAGVLLATWIAAGSPPPEATPLTVARLASR